MSKSILLSIRPEWVAKILNGEKTIEIRKQFPKDFRGWVYIYCTKDKKQLVQFDNEWNTIITIRGPKVKSLRNGKVVARFWCDKIDIHHILPTENILPFNQNVEPKLKQLCLTKEQVMNYGKGEDYYAHLIHISKLEIFDIPRELSEFHKIVNIRKCDTRYCDDYYTCNKCVHSRLTKAPQNYCYVESEN